MTDNTPISDDNLPVNSGKSSTHVEKVDVRLHRNPVPNANRIFSSEKIASDKKAPLFNTVEPIIPAERPQGKGSIVSKINHDVPDVWAR